MSSQQQGQGQGGQGQGGQGGPPTGPPYAPTTWQLGGRVDEGTDIPVTSVFLFLFLLGAVGHMAIFQKNRKRNHKFLMSIMLFAFCMCRVLTCILRISWATQPKNIKLGIAAQIFVAAGVLLIFIINLLFTQRLIRARHPKLGWSKPFSALFKVNYFIIVCSLIMVITVTVQSFYTKNTNTHRIDRDIQLYTATYFSFVSFLPIPITIIGILAPRKTRLEKFGSGRFRTKVTILLLASFLLCLGACYRCGTAWKDPVSVRQPLPTYYSKACFYIFNFTVEIMVVYLYIILRIDLRFYIPDGASGPGSYAPVSNLDDKHARKYDSGYSMRERAAAQASGLNNGVYTEEETFDDEPLKLKTDFKRHRFDLEAEPQSAISGTTAALSKDHLLLPESPKPAFSKSEKDKEKESIPPVPKIPFTSQSAGSTLSQLSSADKLDKVVELLVSLDRRLTSLEENPRHNNAADDLLVRIERRLSHLDGGAAANSSGKDSKDGAAGSHNRHASLDTLDRIDARLSRLEDFDTRHSRRASEYETMRLLDNRLSRMERRISTQSGMTGRPASPDRQSRSSGFSRYLDPYATNVGVEANSLLDGPMQPFYNPQRALAQQADARPTSSQSANASSPQHGSGSPSAAVRPGGNSRPRSHSAETLSGSGFASRLSSSHRFSRGPAAALVGGSPDGNTWPLDEEPELSLHAQQTSALMEATDADVEEEGVDVPAPLRPGAGSRASSMASAGTAVMYQPVEQEEPPKTPERR
ncbi:uncharacterized protein J3D65DRAFT_317801 [Phyllosticta citribraziliensis]|uniref:Uncharacterized protein n=1 Tax=Phyllosticta citribraziliensis TaxID=989973 RepID=A0ABR1LSI2_9PEZI